MTDDSHGIASADVIREVRSFTELMRASVGQIIDEEAARPVDRTPMLAWDATHGRYQFTATSLDEVQAHVTKIINTRALAAGVLITQLALRVVELDQEATLTDVTNQVEKKVIAGLAADDEEGM